MVEVRMRLRIARRTFARVCIACRRRARRTGCAFGVGPAPVRASSAVVLCGRSCWRRCGRISRCVGRSRRRRICWCSRGRSRWRICRRICRCMRRLRRGRISRRVRRHVGRRMRGFFSGPRRRCSSGHRGRVVRWRCRRHSSRVGSRNVRGYSRRGRCRCISGRVGGAVGGVGSGRRSGRACSRAARDRHKALEAWA